MFNLFEQLKTTVKALKALIDYKFNILDKRIFNILHDEEFEIGEVQVSELTWDGVITDNMIAVDNPHQPGACYVLISEQVPTIEELSQGGSIVFRGLEILGAPSNEFSYDAPMDVLDNGSVIAMAELGPMIVTVDNYDVAGDGSLILPKKGIYSIYVPPGVFSDAQTEPMYTSHFSINNYNKFTSIGKIITTPLKQIDKKYIPGGVADWNVNDSTASGYIENRPFYDAVIETKRVSGDALTWDMDIDGLETDNYQWSYRISATPISEEILSNGGSVVFDNNANYTETFDTYNWKSGDVIYFCDYYLASVLSDGATDDEGVTFPKAGIYISKNLLNGPSTISITFNVYNGGFEVFNCLVPSKKIDKKYLPNSVVNVAQQYEWDNLVTWNNLPEIYTDVVRYDTTQNLNNAQKSQAILNLGLSDVLRSSAQTLSDSKKARVKLNLGIEDQKQADWNEKNTSNVQHVLNRPFYEDITDILVSRYNQTTSEIPATTTSIGNLFYSKTDENYYGGIGDNLYVPFDNQTYKKTLIIGGNGKPSFYAWGNLSFITDEVLSFLILGNEIYYRDIKDFDKTDTGQQYCIIEGGSRNNSFYRYIVCISSIEGFEIGDIYERSINLKQLDEKYIPDTIVRKSDQLQPDWNQIDNQSSDFIKNKTHWFEHVKIESSSLPLISSQVGDYSYRKYEYDLSILNDSMYIITMVISGSFGKNTTSYNCAIKKNENGEIYIGSPEISTKNDGEYPFLIKQSSSYMEVYYENIEQDDGALESVSFTFTIEGIHIHYLDEKFIPDTIARTSDIEEYVNAAKDYIILKDTSTGTDYKLVITDGQLYFDTVIPK